MMTYLNMMTRCAQLAFLVLLAGCDAGASDDVVPGPVIQGNWKGIASLHLPDGSSVGSATVTLHLIQKGKDVSGTGTFEPFMIVGPIEDYVPPTFSFKGTYTYPDLNINADVRRSDQYNAWSFGLNCTVESPSSLTCTYEEDELSGDVEMARE